jgi:hypothetical protein
VSDSAASESTVSETTAVPADVGPADPADPPRGRRERVVSQLAAVWPALAVYLGVRLFSVLVLALNASPLHRDTLRALDTRNDAGWYAGIVDHGYAAGLVTGPDGHLVNSNLAFFPLFPALTWTLKTVTGLGTLYSALTVAWLAGIAAAWGIFKVGEYLHDRRTGIVLVALWVVVPHAMVQSMAYSETLFAALAAWSIYAVLKRNWLTAGVLGLVAGLSRPTANAVIAMVGLAAVVALVRRRDGWRPWLAIVLAPLGYLGFLAFVGLRLGRFDGYVHVQRDAWGTSFDGGRYTAHAFARYLRGEQKLEVYVVLLMIVITLMLYVVMLIERTRWEVVVFTTVALIFVLMVSGAFFSKGRFMMPIFPVLIAPAAALARARTRNAVTVLAGLALIAAWFGSYLLLTWRFSP